MTSLRALIAGERPLLLPGAHDALTARLIEHAGFEAYSIGGSSLAASQLALPDIGLQSFGEYVAGVDRAMAGSSLPVMVDAEHGFGDVKAVTRTVRAFERLGIGGFSIEDLRFPPSLTAAPSIVPLTEIESKLLAALTARTDPDTMIVGRTDAAAVGDLDEAILRARRFEAIGCDGVLLTGLADRDALARVRDAVSIPIVAIVVESGPWFAPTPSQLAELGVEAALYPASILLAALSGARDALGRIRDGAVDLPSDGIGHAGLRSLVDPDAWAGIDRAADAVTADADVRA